MEISRGTWVAAIKLAAMFSVVAAVLTLGLTAIGDISPVALIASVVIVGFATSWVVTGRATHASHSPHRVAVVPLRHHVG